MIDVVYSPAWFYGDDIIIDIFSVVILSLISYFSLKYYKINRSNKNYLHMGISFIILVLSFLFKIISNFTIYYVASEVRQLGFVVVKYAEIRSSDLLFFTGFFGYRILTLLGLYLLYSIFKNEISVINIFFFVYLSTIAMYFSQHFHQIFYLTMFILFFLITLEYSIKYKKNKHIGTKQVMYSFGLLTISAFLLIFIDLSLAFYALAGIIQLFGYIMLMFTFYRVLKNAKKAR